LNFFLKSNEITFYVDSVKFKYNYKKNILDKLPQVKKLSSSESESPDKKWIVFIQDYNIWLKNIETNDTVQLSFDGTEKYDYGSNLSWYSINNESNPIKKQADILVYWSPDSKKLIVPRYNRTNAQKLYLLKTTPKKGFRSELYSYERPLAGDSLLTTIEYVLFDVELQKQINLKISPNAPFLNYSIEWLQNSTKAFLLKYDRGYKKREFVEIDASTGEIHLIIQENATTYLDPLIHSHLFLESTNQLIWTSEKDGYNHIYMYSLRKGTQKMQITKGNFMVHKIVFVDEYNGEIYFTASGLEPGDPYFTYLYSISFYGKELKKITKDYANHIIYKSSDKKFLIDVFSRVDMPTKAVVYRLKDNRIIMNLTTANIDSLVAWGWKPAEPFKVKARDDSTDIYGLIYRPSNFDSAKKYPIIDATYSGPHTIRTPKSFKQAIINNDLALAELGFIVITVDGLGTAYRSKKFHDFSYKNLGDIGCEDHIKAIKELAQKYPSFDTASVGIYGHSAGGYDAVRALILRPDFYKVAVSSAGNHDHRVAKAWWPELYMGYPVSNVYNEQSNILNAGKIKGKLLLAHGNMDNNVNPAGTFRLSDALIKANKDFELIITPGDNHGDLYYNKYFIRKRWDFFVTNLQGKIPPLEYKIKDEAVK